jgi:hypothetical protein
MKACALLTVVLIAGSARAEVSAEERAAHNMKIAGIVLTAVGTAAALVTLAGGIWAATSSADLPINAWITTGVGSAIAIPLFAIGVPLMIVGAQREKRARAPVGLSLAPGGLALAW